MNDKMRESLSALLDDEANELELERVLAHVEDEELRAAWLRYNLARQSTGAHEMAHFSLDVSGQVRAAIDAEKSTATGGLRRMLRPLASLGVAASVAATVVIGGQQLAGVRGADPYGANITVAANPSPVSMVNNLGAVPVQATYGTRSIPVLQPATRTAYQKLARQRMGKYMQQHAEHAALNSPQGLIPFARVPRIKE
jgi:sigma-E factor negative regulatory protein RseA